MSPELPSLASLIGLPGEAIAVAFLELLTALVEWDTAKWQAAPDEQKRLLKLALDYVEWIAKAFPLPAQPKQDG